MRLYPKSPQIGQLIKLFVRSRRKLFTTAPPRCKRRLRPRARWELGSRSSVKYRYHGLRAEQSVPSQHCTGERDALHKCALTGEKTGWPARQAAVVICVWRTTAPNGRVSRPAYVVRSACRSQHPSRRVCAVMLCISSVILMRANAYPCISSHATCSVDDTVSAANQ